MRSILMTVMLIIVAVAIYNSTIGGEGGTKQALRDGAGLVSDTIERINP